MTHLRGLASAATVTASSVALLAVLAPAPPHGGEPRRSAGAGVGSVDARAQVAGPPTTGVHDSMFQAKGQAARPPKRGLSDQRLQGLVDRVILGRSVDPDVALVRSGRIRVEVVGHTGAQVASAVRDLGGRVIGRIRTLVLADVPASRMQSLEARPDVDFVRLPQDVGEPVGAQGHVSGPTSVIPALTTSFARLGARGQEAVAKTQVGAWHTAGFTGAGVRIGIIDTFNLTGWQSAQAQGELPAPPTSTFCRNNGVDCAASLWSGGTHGDAVAEVVSDMAPGASLSLASATSATDLKAAVDFFKSQGVRIITRSETAKYDGPGNGSGPIADVMAYAVSQGMAWFNSAGNAGNNQAGAGTWPGAYFRQPFQDLNGNGWMEFPGSKYPEYLEFSCNRGFINGLRWNDWGANRTDYDLEIYEEPNDATLISESTADQQAGAPPLETAATCTQGSDPDYLSVKLYNPGAGTAGDILEFMTNDSRVELASNPYSASGPAADTSTPGTASVGAVDPVMGTTIGGYSSEGPTNDGRIKPDLSAASGMSSYTFPGAAGFEGTSAATPVVAGAAAVVLSSNPAATPAQLVDSIRGAVVERGSPGPDNVYGNGELVLPPPPARASGVSVESARVFPSLHTLTTKFPVIVRWTVSGSQASAAVWRSLDNRQYTRSATVTTRHRARARMVLGQRNRYAIRAFDAAGTASDWLYTRTFRPRLVDDRDSHVRYGRGWSHLHLQGASHGTISATQQGTGSAHLRFTGSAVSLVMVRSGNSGKVRVLIDGRPIEKINLRTRKVELRRVVANYWWPARGRHTITIKPLTKGRNGSIFLDGLLVVG